MENLHLQNKQVLCNLPLFKEIIYHKSSGLFHQFADKNTLYGLRFTGEEEAARFAASFENVISALLWSDPNEVRSLTNIFYE